MSKEKANGREVIFEFYTIGTYVKVSAIDVTTCTEISIQCPAKTPESMMRTNALKRLEYVLRKKELIL